MIKNLYFDYSAMVILIVMLIALHLKRGMKGRTNRAFLYLVLTMTYATMYDICAVFLDNNHFNNAVLKYTMHAGYLILRNLVPLMYVCYIITLTNTWHIIEKKGYRFFLIIIPFAAVFVLTLSSPFTKLVFYLDENVNYTRGPLFIILYISALFYSGFGLFYSAKYYKQLTFQKFLPLILIVPLQALSTAIQFVHPTLLVELLFSAISLLFIMLTIQRPESMIDPNTSLFRRGLYNENIRLACINSKELKILYILITNHESLLSLLNYSDMLQLLRRIASGIKNIAVDSGLDDAELYYLNNGKFAAVVDSNDFDKSDLFINALKDFFDNEITVNDTPYSIPANVCILNIPEDLSIYDEVTAFENDLSDFEFSSDIINASEIVKKKDYRVIAKMDSILNNAIKNRLFEVYYQPIYSIKEKRFNSAEALIRLKTEEFGFIRPDIFIPLAEESGAINEIDEIVLDEVCKFISSEEFKELNLDYIEVNLSVVQCMQPDLATNILNTLNKYGVKPSQINLEITETAAEYSQKAILDNITVLNEAGISFSLDDFGTGYSNMGRIISLPLHIVKLDRSFATTKGNTTLLSILENSIQMIQRMELKIVVEGVETKEMLDQFEVLSCDYIQGYYFSKPLPKTEFTSFIKDRLNTF